MLARLSDIDWLGTPVALLGLSAADCQVPPSYSLSAEGLPARSSQAATMPRPDVPAASQPIAAQSGLDETILDVVMTDGPGPVPLHVLPSNNDAISSGDFLQPATGLSRPQGASSSSDRPTDHMALAAGSVSATSLNGYSEAWRGIPHV
eukprot:1322056-Heterocapsa_arctica.AAC.1